MCLLAPVGRGGARGPLTGQAPDHPTSPGRGGAHFGWSYFIVSWPDSISSSFMEKLYMQCHTLFEVGMSALPFLNFIFYILSFSPSPPCVSLFFALLAWNKPWCAPAVCGQGVAPPSALLAQSFMCWFLRSAIIYCIRFMFLPEHK